MVPRVWRKGSRGLGAVDVVVVLVVLGLLIYAVRLDWGRSGTPPAAVAKPH
jgi:hypothetical protein